MTAQHPIDAGPFLQWLRGMRAALRGEQGTDVPCGECRGCCVSSYPIPLRPRDREALARTPPELLLEAPGMAPGHKLMGYRDDGTCPMLAAGNCSIYEQRPQTCRDYDCRIFAAAGLAAGGPAKAVINERVGRWRFTYPAEEDRRAYEALRRAASFIQSKASSFPNGRAPTASTGIAVLAIKCYEVFLDPEVDARRATDTAEAIVNASRAFDVTPAIADTAQADATQAV